MTSRFPHFRKLVPLLLLLVLSLALASGCGGGGGGGGSTASGGSSGGSGGGGTSTPTGSPTPNPGASPPAPPPLAVPSGAATAKHAHRPGVVLVRQRGRGLDAEALGRSAGLRLRQERSWPRMGLQKMRILSGESVEQAVKRLSALPGVEYAEPDYIVRADEFIPNDPRFNELWGLKNTGQSGGTAGADIEATFAWDTTLGSSQVVVGVIDTGVDYNHQDLSSRMWTNPGEVPGNGQDDDSNGFVDDVFGINAEANNGNPLDDNEHGTHVAGTIAAAANNGVGVAGVAPNVRIMALKFLDNEGFGSISDAVTCLDYAIAKGARICNASWGGGGFSQSFSDALNRARNANILFVAAAGNDSSDNDADPHYPSSYTQDNVVAVAASTRNEGIASFSNFGATSVDLFAPGLAILSTIPGNAYDTFSGTSMATPHVAGVAALVLSLDLNQSYLAVRTRVISSVEPIAAYAGRCATGGRLNARLAVSSTLPDVLLSDVSPTGGAPGQSVTLSGLGFGASQGAGRVIIGGLDAGVTSWVDNRIVCTVPQGLSAGATTVSVVNNDAETSNTLPFTVESGIVYLEESTAFGFQSIAASGTPLNLGDDGNVVRNLGFTFPFYGENQTQVTVSANGYLTFGGDGSVFGNVPIPNSGQPNRLVAVLWTDLNPTSAGDVFVQTRGSAPNREFVVQWDAIAHYPDTGAATFQAVLRENSQDVVFHYQDVVFGSATHDNGASATIGVENGSGSRGTQHSGTVANGTSIRFFPSGSPSPSPSPSSSPSASPTPLETLPLGAGWNLVSFPVRQLTQVVVGSGVGKVFVFNGATQTYQQITPTVGNFNAGTGMRRGFWVYATIATQIQYAGLDNDGSVRTVDLSGPGWNLIGAPDRTTIPLDQVLVTDLQTTPTPPAEPLANVIGPDIPASPPVFIFSYLSDWLSGNYSPFDASLPGQGLAPKQGHWVYAWRPVRLEFQSIVVTP